MKVFSKRDENFMKAKSRPRLMAREMFIATAAPLKPTCSLSMISQQSGTWQMTVTAEHIINWNTARCVWKNLMTGNRSPYESKIGTSQ